MPSILLAQYEVLPEKKTLNFDTTYIKSYRDQLIIRTYGITKYNRLTIRDVATANQVSFDPNTNLNFGAGFNYKWIGFNAAFNFPFINNDSDRLGTTKYLDLQADFYGRKYLINVLYQDYRGFRISKERYYSFPQFITSDTLFQKRDDVHTRAFGINGFYNFNDKKFSYLSSFIQNEWQKRSAGSFFLGGYFTGLQVSSDSSLISADLNAQFENNLNIVRGNFRTLGVSGGYAHTFVMWKKFFFTLLASGGIGAEYSEIKTVESNQEFNTESSLNFSTFTRGALGYNNDRFHVGLSFSSNISAYREQKLTNVIYQSGNVRFYFVKRFQLGKHS
ncbi:MAG: DUF4421 domain-containing protein [Bacteroidota bacterium]